MRTLSQQTLLSKGSHFIDDYPILIMIMLAPITDVPPLI